MLPVLITAKTEEQMKLLMVLSEAIDMDESDRSDDYYHDDLDAALHACRMVIREVIDGLHFRECEY